MIDVANNSTPSQLLESLAYELKNPLTLIARQAELEALNTKNSSFKSIQEVAEQTLKLIDSYHLMAQSEYGQIKLPLEAIGVGAVVYDVLQELTPYARNRETVLSSDVRSSIAMTHPLGLKTALWCLVKLAINYSPADEPKPGDTNILVTAKNYRGSIDINVLGNQLNVAKSDLLLARKFQGRSRMAMCLKNEGSGIQLAIAEILAGAIGDGLYTTKRGSLSGFGLRISKSQQLALI